MPQGLCEALGTVHLSRDHRAKLLPRPPPLDPGGAHLGRGGGRGSRRATFREGLHDVVQERLELVREIDVVNDHVVVAGLLDGAVEVWLPQAKPIAKRPLKLVIADHVAGRWNAVGGVGSEADLVCPGFWLGLMAEPNNAQRAFDVIHDGMGTPMRSVSHRRGRLSSDDAAPRRGPEAAARPGRFLRTTPGRWRPRGSWSRPRKGNRYEEAVESW